MSSQYECSIIFGVPIDFEKAFGLLDGSSDEDIKRRIREFNESNPKLETRKFASETDEVTFLYVKDSEYCFCRDYGVLNPNIQHIFEEGKEDDYLGIIEAGLFSMGLKGKTAESVNWYYVMNDRG